MRRLRNFSLILFVLSLALFVFYRVREVNQRDGSGPDILMDSDSIEVSVEDPEEALLNGVTAKDRKDGDVTDSLIVENVSNFLRPGVRIVRYAAFDQDLHVTHAEREMTYTDYRAPEFSIREPLVFSSGSMDIVSCLSVSDCLDGDLTDSVRILSDSQVLIDVEGTYEVRLQAANSAGDVVTLPVTVTVSSDNRSVPRIMLEAYSLYIDPGETFDPYDLITGVAINGAEYDVVSGSGTYGDEDADSSKRPVVGTDMIKVRNSVEEVPGVYEVTYEMSVPGDYGTKLTGSTTLYVIVRDKGTTASADGAETP